ncbi:putative Pre-mRNA-splicing factor SPF27-like protein [Nannochloris sp. 'desiccata']|nr:putative Pre-mRNA-splicing factor SPF27-like protein [Chlorella desiccata (nom. nud.)]
MSGQPLALASEAFVEQKGWRRKEELVDSLPYIDGLEAGEKEAVMRLVEEEARNSDKKPADYLSELPAMPPSRIEKNELLQSELQRVSTGTPLSALDLQRYNLNPPPSSQRGDPAAWQTALDNAHAQLEHQRNRLLNLELLLKFGPITWRAHNESLAAHVANLQSELETTRGAIDQLNRERKLQQTSAGRELRALESEYVALIAKNIELEAACKKVESEATAAGANAGNPA